MADYHPPYCSVQFLGSIIDGRNIHQKVQLCLDDFFHKVASNLPVGKRDNILQAVQIFINAIKNAAGVCDCCT